MAKLPRRPKKDGEYQTRKMVNALTELAAFEEFKESILPSIREDIKKGLSADDIYAKYEKLAAARTVTIIATEPDSGKALSAIKELRDRNSGKAVEKKEISHRLEKLPEEQLDALLLTELSESSESDEEKDQTDESN